MEQYTLFEKLLEYYHLSKDDYLELQKDYTLENFTDGHIFKDIDLAVSLVKNAINNHQKIMIYGDYDCDGIMGTSILVKALNLLDYRPEFYIPSRYIEGYGITLEKAKDFVNEGFNLVITVDNGISCYEAISYLREHGTDVLIIDHHQVGETVPNANYIIHPQYSGFSELATSGAFTAFMFTSHLLGYKDKYLATLAAISLISDMMPLKDFNRRLLKIIFKDYNDDEFYPISLLADAEKLDENLIGMKIAPRVNAIGRMIEDRSINDIVKFFVIDDQEKQLNYFNYILYINEERKNLTKEIDIKVDENNSKKAIVCLSEAKEGIIGLIANSLINKYQVPVVVFSNDKGDGLLKGSVRSLKNFNVVDNLKKLDYLLETSGGHANAGGCSLKKENFEEFKKEFIKLAEIASDIVEKSEELPSIRISINDINKDNYELVRSFSPFGEGWKAPNLEIDHIRTSSLFFSRDAKHINHALSPSAKLLGFNMPKEVIREYQFIDIFGSLRKSVYRGNYTYEFVISTYKETE